LGGEFFPFFGKIYFGKKNIIFAISLFIWGTQFARKRKENPKEPSKLSQLPTIYMNGCLRFSTFMFLNIAKFWLTILMEDHRHLTNITKLKKQHESML
jgi:hypothetical protein